MKNYILYNNITGEILYSIVVESVEQLSPVLDNTVYLEVAGFIDNGKYYLDPQSQQTVAFSDKPDQYHTWNWDTKSWQDTRTDQEKYTQTAKTVKTQRTNLLNASDWVVVKAMDQGTQVPEAWQTYRQQLRDITQQPGYPFTVTWPESPQ